MTDRSHWEPCTAGCGTMMPPGQMCFLCACRLAEERRMAKAELLLHPPKKPKRVKEKPDLAGLDLDHWEGLGEEVRRRVEVARKFKEQGGRA